MEYFGLLALMLLMSYSNLPKKLDALRDRIQKLEKGKGEPQKMSDIIKSLVGQQCVLKDYSGITGYTGTVLEVDEEWIKLAVVEKNQKSIAIKRIENIKEISVVCP